MVDGTDGAATVTSGDDRMTVEKEHDRNRSVIEIYERVGVGGVHVDRPEPNSTDSVPRERIRSSADDRSPKRRDRRPRET